MFKKIFLMLIVPTFCLSLIACGKSAEEKAIEEWENAVDEAAREWEKAIDEMDFSY